MRVLAPLDDLPDLLRKLHAAGVGLIFLELTGIGYVVSFTAGPPVDLTGYVLIG
jgi:hypothetical protein